MGKKYKTTKAEPLTDPPDSTVFVRWDELAAQATGRGWRVRVHTAIEDGYYRIEDEALRDFSICMEAMNG